MKFLGTYQELKARIHAVGMSGAWRELGKIKQFRAENGAILCWWESTGTICFQGKEPAASHFHEAYREMTERYAQLPNNK